MTAPQVVSGVLIEPAVAAALAAFIRRHPEQVAAMAELRELLVGLDQAAALADRAAPAEPPVMFVY